MSHIPDEELHANSARAAGKVVVITGAANGIGKETALRFASYGAKIVIGDRDIKNAEGVVAEIKKAGGSAVCIKCDVTNFDNQVDMFDLAIKNYGSVDIVIPNAGVTEIGSFKAVQFKDGRPVKPSMATIDINLYGPLYTAHLALHYLLINKKENDLKALIFIGSVASWMAIPGGEMYSGSKHAILGVMRALHPILEMRGVRVGCIHPFFADTGIVPTPVKLVLAGIPLTPVWRVAGAIFSAATDPDMGTSGSAYLLLDDGPVFRVPKEEFKEGVYKMIDNRANSARAALTGVVAWVRFFRDIWRIGGRAIVTMLAIVAFSRVAWSNKDLIEGGIHSLMAQRK